MLFLFSSEYGVGESHDAIVSGSFFATVNSCPVGCCFRADGEWAVCLEGAMGLINGSDVNGWKNLYDYQIC